MFVLLAWAVIATHLAIRPAGPPEQPREVEALRALVTVLSDPERKRWLRVLACQSILSLDRLHQLESWDHLAKDAVRAFCEKNR